MAKKIIDKEEAKNKLKGGASDFKKFISRGDVVDMAVGIIIGAAFGKIVTSLVDDILMPIIGMIVGGVDFTDLSIKVGSATLKYGMFIQSIVDFLIVAFCIFLVVKLFEKFKKKEAEKEPERADDVKLLTEIRDLLKNKK
jgi:large conductance mechanosensitive channel